MRPGGVSLTMVLALNIKFSRFVQIQIVLVTLILLLGTFRYLFSEVTGVEHLGGFLRLLDVGKEQSIPTYFSVLNLLLAAVLILVICAAERRENATLLADPGAGILLSFCR